MSWPAEFNHTPLADPARLLAGCFFFIDCKSFYASCEAVAHGEDPLAARYIVLSNPTCAGGLVLAASPQIKQEYGLGLGNRAYEIPAGIDATIVPPRMAYYAAVSHKIHQILTRFAPEEALLQYSVDELAGSFAESVTLFGGVEQLAIKIQTAIKNETGIVTTIGGGPNMLLAKFAMDNAAKKKAPWRAYWGYEDVPQTIWKIDDLTNLWGIGDRLNKRLAAIGITTGFDLAHADLGTLEARLGLIGRQLYYHAWGVDYSTLPLKPSLKKAKSVGHSQVLPRPYATYRELELVGHELAAKVATRLRATNKVAAQVKLTLTPVKGLNKRSAGWQIPIPATDQADPLKQAVSHLLKVHWDQTTPIQALGVVAGKLATPAGIQLNLFEAAEKTVATHALTKTVDKLTAKFGPLAVMPAASLAKGATARDRAGLLGGHKA